MPALPSSLDQRSGNGERLAVSLTFRNQTARFFVDFAGERFRGYGPHPVPPTGTSVPWNAANVSTELTVAQKAEARAEGYYVAAVILIYGLSIVLLIASSIKRKPSKQQQDRQIDKYLREFQIVQESSSKSQYRQLKKTIVDKLNSSLLAQDQQQNSKPSHDGLTNLVLPTMSLAFCLPAASNISKPIAKELFNCPSNYEGIRKSSSCIAEVFQNCGKPPINHAFSTSGKSALGKSRSPDRLLLPVHFRHRHRTSVFVPKDPPEPPPFFTVGKHKSLEQLPVTDDLWPSSTSTEFRVPTSDTSDGTSGTSMSSEINSVSLQSLPRESFNSLATRRRRRTANTGGVVVADNTRTSVVVTCATASEATLASTSNASLFRKLPKSHDSTSVRSLSRAPYSKHSMISSPAAIVTSASAVDTTTPKNTAKRLRKLPSYYGKTTDECSSLLPLEPNIVVSSRIDTPHTKETLL